MRALALVAVVTSGACTDGASPDPGLSALLQVEGGQYREGPFPSDEGGPAGIQVAARNANVRIGRFEADARGVFEASARAAVVAIDGIDGAWIVNAGVPDLDTPGLPVARIAFGVTPEMPPGPFTLVMAAAGADGRFGAPVSTELIAADVPPPQGELVIGLVWQGRADLDIHVIDPLGGEAWSDKPNTMNPPPPGTPIDPAAMEHLKHGLLTHDGNGGCVQHAYPSEHVVWRMPPPAGEYIVRVDTRSMCGAPSASWYVEAYRGDELLGAARGTSTPADVLHGAGELGTGRAGAGVTALRFSL